LPNLSGIIPSPSILFSLPEREKLVQALLAIDIWCSLEQTDLFGFCFLTSGSGLVSPGSLVWKSRY
jgi:hypothetical protein